MLENDDFYPTISHIVCMDKFGIIGLDNKMPWHIPEELKYFKKITDNSIVIMGKNTYTSIGKPLSNRINIIVSSTLELQDSSDVYVKNNLEEALSLADVLGHQFQKNIFIIGGSTLYEQTIPYITKAYITVLDVSYFNKIKLDGSKNFVYYPYEKLIDSGFILTETKTLKSTNYFYRITTNILEKIE